MWFLAAITGALLRWSLLAVLALRRSDRLVSHPVLFAKTSHLFLYRYLALQSTHQVRCFVEVKLANKSDYAGQIGSRHVLR